MDSGTGMGAMAGSPQMQALQSTRQVEEGLQQLAQAMPQLAQLAATMITGLRQSVAEALSGSVGGQAGAAGAPPIMPMPPGAGGPPMMG